MARKNMKIIVFISKEIGLDLAKYLIKSFPNDDYLFIVFNDIKDRFLKIIDNTDQKYVDYNKAAIEKIKKENIKYDWLLNLWRAHIFDADTISLANKTLNIHPSLLPMARGSDPVVWTIRNNWSAGCSLHVITPTIDSGPIWVQKEISYEMPITGGVLYKRIIDESINLFKNNWEVIRPGKLSVTSQEKGYKTFFRRELFEDRVIDLNKEEESYLIISKLLAHDFSPDYTAHIKINDKKYSAKLILSEVKNDE